MHRAQPRVSGANEPRDAPPLLRSYGAQGGGSHGAPGPSSRLRRFGAQASSLSAVALAKVEACEGVRETKSPGENRDQRLLHECLREAVCPNTTGQVVSKC